MWNHFSGRGELSECLGAVRDYALFAARQSHPAELSHTYVFDSPINWVSKDQWYAEIHLHGEEETLGGITAKYAAYCLEHRLNLDEFTLEEQRRFAAEAGRFTLIRPDGSSETYSDLVLSEYGYSMSFGTLYEMLRREGADVEGSAWRYRFIGMDGAEYEISYEFASYPYERDGGLDFGYYYLRDGVQTHMEAFFYNHFSSGEIKDMTGYAFEKLYPD